MEFDRVLSALSLATKGATAILDGIEASQEKKCRLADVQDRIRGVKGTLEKIDPKFVTNEVDRFKDIQTAL